MDNGKELAAPGRELWSPAQAQAFLGCSKHVLDSMIARGDFKAWRFSPKRLKIDAEGVRAYLGVEVAK